MYKKNLITIFFRFSLSNLFAQGEEDPSKATSLDLYYIPKNIIQNISLGKGYDLSDPFYPVPADSSPFIAKNPIALGNFLKSFKPQIDNVSTGSGSNNYSLHYDDHVTESMVGQFYYADLKLGGLAASLEAAISYEKTEHDFSKGIHFVLENQSALPSNDDLNINWQHPPVTEYGLLDETAKWRVFRGRYGSHFVSSFSYGFRIEIIAFANSSDADSRTNLAGAFNTWFADGKFGATISSKILASNASIDIKIYCKDIINTKTGSHLPFSCSGIAEVLQFLDDLKNGIIEITPAPTSLSFKSYYSSVCSNYPKSCALFDEKVIAIDPNAIPKGTILSWIPPAKNIKVVNDQTFITLPPGGWAICDKPTHDLNPNVPDLTDKFVMGTASPREIGQTGGTKEHSHSGTTSSAGDGKPDAKCFAFGPCIPNQGTGLAHTHNFGTDSQPNLPPFVKAVFIIKL